MRDTNPMDSAVEGQQQIFAPSPSLQVSRAVPACAQVFVPHGEEVEGRQQCCSGERETCPYSHLFHRQLPPLLLLGGTVCPWADSAG